MVTTTDYLSIKRGTRKVGPDHRVVVVEKEHSCLTPTDAINAFGRPSTILYPYPHPYPYPKGPCHVPDSLPRLR